jgi:hypothetical protein
MKPKKKRLSLKTRRRSFLTRPQYFDLDQIREAGNAVRKVALLEGCEVKDELERRSPKPLTASVRTTASLLDVGVTTVWGLIKSRRVDVIRLGRRTLVTMASFEALVATLSSPHIQRQELDENEGSDNVVHGRDAKRLSRAQSIDGNNSQPADNAKASQRNDCTSRTIRSSKPR